MFIDYENTPSCSYLKPFGGNRARFGGEEFHLAYARSAIQPGKVTMFILSHRRQDVVVDELLPVTRNSSALVHLARVASMTVEDFRRLLSSSASLRYDPFVEAMTHDSIRKRDKKVRASLPALSNGGLWDAAEKKRLLHDWEKLVLAVTCQPFCNTVVADRLTPRLYRLLHMRGGYHAHGNRRGFALAQMSASSDAMRLVRTLTKGDTTYGTPISRPGEDDLFQHIRTIGATYLGS